MKLVLTTEARHDQGWPQVLEMVHAALTELYQS